MRAKEEIPIESTFSQAHLGVLAEKNQQGQEYG
jgi:hypothetical protein